MPQGIAIPHELHMGHVTFLAHYSAHFFMTMFNNNSVNNGQNGSVTYYVHYSHHYCVGLNNGHGLKKCYTVIGVVCTDLVFGLECKD